MASTTDKQNEQHSVTLSKTNGEIITELSTIRESNSLGMSSDNQENFMYWPVKVEMETCEQELPESWLQVERNLFKKPKSERLDNGMKERPLAIVCIICRMEFGNTKDLEEHMIRHHPLEKCMVQKEEKVVPTNEKREYTCLTCGKQFKRAEHRRRHELSHTDLKPFRCDECGSAFKRNEHLKRHMYTHYEIRPFQCSFCSKSFNRKEHLKRHELTHEAIDNLTAAQNLLQTVSYTSL